MKGRRGAGEGGVHQQADGLWCASISLGRGPDGRRRRVKIRRKAKGDLLVELDLRRRALVRPAMATPVHGAHEPMTCSSDARGVLRAEQGGRCAVCGATNPRCLDHDHTTGLIRGLLCRRCNLVEGKSVDGTFDAYRATPPASGRWYLCRCGNVHPSVAP